MIEREMMPFKNTQFLLKLTRGDPKGRRHFGSNFIYWYAVMYITSAKLPLSTKTLLALYLSIVSMIMSGSSCGCRTPLASCSKKTILPSPERRYFAIGCFTWMLLTCVWNAFLKDQYDPPMTGPPIITRISPTAYLGQSYSSVIRFFFCPWPRLIVFLDKLLKPPSLNQFLNLFLQIATLISVMAMIFVEAKIFLWNSSFWGRT